MTPAPTDRRLDLDAARAARAAARNGAPAPTLVVAGQDFELPPELPLDALNVFGALAAGDVRALELGLEAMVNGALDVKGEPVLLANGKPDLDDAGEPKLEPTNFERFKVLAGGFSLDDAEWIIDEVCGAYGLEAPKSQGSSESSSDTSTSSSPTSGASTG